MDPFLIQLSLLGSVNHLPECPLVSGGGFLSNSELIGNECEISGSHIKQHAPHICSCP